MTASTEADARPRPRPFRPASSAAVLRVRVVASAGEVDLVVPAGATPPALLEGLGLDPGLAVGGSTGRSLAPDASLAQQGVRDGDLLVVGPLGSVRASVSPREGASLLPSAGSTVPRVILTPGALALCGLAAGWSAAVDPWARVAVALVTVVAGVVTALAPRRGLLPAGAQALTPGFAAAAAVALVPREEPRDDLVAILVAGAVVAQIAVLLRFVATRASFAALTAWTVGGAVVAGLAALALAADGRPRVVWAGVVCVAVVAAALLPQVAIDAPDEQLLDTDRMSATTWTARSAAPRVTRVRVRPREVAEAVDAGRRLVCAGAIAASAAAAAGCAGLALDPIAGWSTWLSFATGIVVGVALASLSRAYGGYVPKIALRVGGLIAAAAAAGALLAEVNTIALVSIAGAAPVLAVPVLIAAARLGHGWRSVWWSRLGDGFGNLAVAASLPCALLAAGTIEYMRQLVS